MMFQFLERKPPFLWSATWMSFRLGDFALSFIWSHKHIPTCLGLKCFVVVVVVVFIWCHTSYKFHFHISFCCILCFFYMGSRSMVVPPGYLILGWMLRMALQTNREQNGERDTWSCRISLYMRSSIRCHPRGTHDAHALDIISCYCQLSKWILFSPAG